MNIKLGLKVLGAVAWVTAWIGGPMWLLKRDMDREEKLSKERDKEWYRRRGLTPPE
jgi:hypothetical protein